MWCACECSMCVCVRVCVSIGMMSSAAIASGRSHDERMNTVCGYLSLFSFDIVVDIVMDTELEDEC